MKIPAQSKRHLYKIKKMYTENVMDNIQQTDGQNP